MRKWSVLLLICFAACTPSGPRPTPTVDFVGAGAVAPKRLATVAISPTPNEAQRQATELARPQQAATPAPRPTATATVYIGLFLGERASDTDGVPVLDPTRFAQQGLLPAPTPTLVLARCGIQPDPSFGEGWRADTTLVRELGCPIEFTLPFVGTAQLFERGIMYFRPSGQIWVIAPRSERYWFVDPVPEAEPEVLAAPTGLRVPQLGFGAVWSTVEGVRDELGWARLDETEVTVSLQRFEGGTLFLDVESAQVFVLLTDGTALGPF